MIRIYWSIFSQDSQSSVHFQSLLPDLKQACEIPCASGRTKLLSQLLQLALVSHNSDLVAPPLPVLKINDHATGGRRTKDILGGPKSLETKKLGSSKGWEDQSAEKTNNWKDKKYITNRWDTKKLNILLKTETTVHCEIIHLWRGNLVCMCSYPC